MSSPVISERKVLFLVGAVQFVNVLDFMMVMPLGPDFAKALHFPEAHIGYIGGAYTASAGVAGLIAANFLDRFDRRPALAFAMLGLVIGTLAGGFATGLETLIAARVVAGAFGGPATSLAISIVADVIPPERRGAAMGKVMGAFSIASVFGVPAGLELARLGGWSLPFFAVGGLCFVVAAAATFLLPSLTLHMRGDKAGMKGSLSELLTRPLVMWSLLASISVMMGAFTLIPNVSAYLQHNVGYPRDRLGVLYMVGGAFTFVSMRMVGVLVDRYSAPVVSFFGTAFYATVVLAYFVFEVRLIPVMALFVCFMLASSSRMVSLSAQSTRVPLPHERARFLSIQSATQHFASASGAFVASQLLTTDRETGALVHMPLVASLAVGLACATPVLLKVVYRGLERRDPPVAAPPPAVVVAE